LTIAKTTNLMYTLSVQVTA